MARKLTDPEKINVKEVAKSAPKAEPKKIYRLYDPYTLEVLFFAEVVKFDDLIPLYKLAREHNQELPYRDDFNDESVCLWTVEYPKK